MSSSLKPIKIYGGAHGPNPPKVLILAEELGLPYEIEPIGLGDVKKPEFLAVNPNGRLPAIHDPNTGLTLWESGAILQYLVDRYDTEHKVSFPPGTTERYLSDQYLFFQVSGQGPYFGQAMWFQRFHSEDVPSAKERYMKEVNRVTSVLEDVLKKEEGKGGDGPWLVGGKYTYADLSFIPWGLIVSGAFADKGLNMAEYPLVKKWLDNMVARPGVKAALSQHESLKGYVAK